MRSFFVFSALYLCAAFVLVQLVRGDGTVSALVALRDTLALVPSANKVILVLAGICASGYFLCRYLDLRAVALRVVYALAGTICFVSAFGLVKTLLPEILPFHADRLFADADLWLHGGVDPWRLAHDWAPHLPMAWIEPLYLQVWLALAMLLPLFLAMQDPDQARVRRTLILYSVAWVFLGNVLALAGMSAGPVYYDRLLGGIRFAELNAVIDAGTLASPVIPYVQDALWQFYVEGSQTAGTGISAFPSVHVAVACVGMLYACERLPVLTPVAVAYLAAIQFLSVYTGYHYAVDGYVSILVILGAWAWLRRRDARGQADDVPEMVAVPAE